MARTAQARDLRSFQTSPNSGTVRDLTNGAGGGANSATSAAFAVGGTITGIRWSPNVSSAVANAPPAVDAAAANMGYKDVVAENANDAVQYSAGTWTIRTRVSKSGQTVPVDLTVRVTAILYKIAASGGASTEIGRVVMADTVISTSIVSITGSFTTGGVTDFAAGGKMQLEVYVQPILAGAPAAPAAAVNFNLVVDEASTQSAITAIPSYVIPYVRALVGYDAAGGTDAITRAATTVRAFVDAAAGADVSTRATVQARALNDSAPAIDVKAVPNNSERTALADPLDSTFGASSTPVLMVGVVTRAFIGARGLTESAPAIDTVTRASVYARSRTETAPATDVVARVAAFPRALTDTAPATDVLTRIKSMLRALTDTASATDILTRMSTPGRAFTDAAPGTDLLTRIISAVRGLTDQAPAILTQSRQTTQARAMADVASTSEIVSRGIPGFRSLTDLAPASETLSRLITFGRPLNEEIGTTVVDLVPTPSKAIAGTIRDSSNAVVSGATVKLVRQSDDRVVRTTTSAADGTYSFARDVFDSRSYYVTCYKTGVPEVHAISDRDLIPV